MTFSSIFHDPFDLYDFAEQLNVNLADTDFNLSIGLFPKQNRKQGISMTVAKANLRKTLDSDTTPESVADFILGIELRIQEIEMQKQKVRDIALDLLKRNIGAILEEKGYEYEIHPPYKDKASLIITFSDVFNMTLEVDLMEDFLDEVATVVKAFTLQDWQNWLSKEVKIFRKGVW